MQNLVSEIPEVDEHQIGSPDRKKPYPRTGSCEPESPKPLEGVNPLTNYQTGAGRNSV